MISRDIYCDGVGDVRIGRDGIARITLVVFAPPELGTPDPPPLQPSHRIIMPLERLAHLHQVLGSVLKQIQGAPAAATVADPGDPPPPVAADPAPKPRTPDGDVGAPRPPKSPNF